MHHFRPPLHRFATLLACALVFCGTTGTATLHALVHAGEAHHSERAPEQGPPDCSLCLATAVQVLVSTPPACFAPASVRLSEGARAGREAPPQTAPFRAPSGLDPPSA